LFEVGKLADEQMRDFLEQLECVNRFAEGEAQRYSEHAMALLDILRNLRKGREVDMLRGESLLSLDPQSRIRVLAKSYGLVRPGYGWPYIRRLAAARPLPIFQKEYPHYSEEDELVYVPFPFDESENEEEGVFSKHPAVKALSTRIGLDCLCGYIVLVNRSVSRKLITNSTKSNYESSVQKESSIVLRYFTLK
uniref:FAM91_C domain-containing protein n=1 Tax=Haemonchus placei TaxID=6290 RepID=A0A0N4VVM8_HAEPC